MSSYIDEMMRQEYEREHRFDTPKKLGIDGGWIIVESSYGYSYYECPYCHTHRGDKNFNYCPNCGKKMVG